MKVVLLFILSWLIAACAEESSIAPATQPSDALVDVGQVNPDATTALDDATAASTDSEAPPVPVSTDPSAFIINEVLYDPGPDGSGDANGDGNRDPYEDEFIEFINRVTQRSMWAV